MKELRFKTFVSIDPGKSGGIVLQKGNDRPQVFKMPGDINRLDTFFKENISDPVNTLCFVEKVQMWQKDNDEDGKQFRILNMVKQFEQIKSVLSLNNITYVQVSPQTWQSVLGLNQKYDKNERTERKNRFKVSAQAWYPAENVTLWNCDALLLHRFLRIKMDKDQQWIWEKIPYLLNNKMF